MKSYRPVKSNWLTQGWNENRACINRMGQVRTKTGLVCDAGFTDFYKSIGMTGHNGVDWATWHGEPVYFCDEFEGWLRHEEDGAGGLGVDIVSNEPIKFCSECSMHHHIKRRFWHGMDRGAGSAMVGVLGRQVRIGDLVMYADNTGASSGDHLHTSIKWCAESGVGIHDDNGFYGAIPDEDFENVFVIEKVLNKVQLTLIETLKSLIINLRAKLYGKS